MHIDDFNLCKTHYSVVHDHNFSQFIKQVAPLKNQFEYQHKMHSFYSDSNGVGAMGIVKVFSILSLLWWFCKRLCMMKVTFQSWKIAFNPTFHVIKSQSLEGALHVYKVFVSKSISRWFWRSFFLFDALHSFPLR